MALTRVDVGRYSSPILGASGWTTAAFTPANNSLLVVALHARGDSAAETGWNAENMQLSNSASLAQTSRVQTANGTAMAYGTRVWTMPVVTGVSMTLTTSTAIGGHIYYSADLEVFTYTDYDVASPIGGTGTGTDADGAGAASLTLGATPATTSEVLGFAINVANSGILAIQNGAGFTEIREMNWEDFWAAESEFRTSSTSTTVDWANLATGGSPSEARMSALEIKQASGGGSIVLMGGMSL